MEFTAQDRKPWTNLVDDHASKGVADISNQEISLELY